VYVLSIQNVNQDENNQSSESLSSSPTMQIENEEVDIVIGNDNLENHAEDRIQNHDDNNPGNLHIGPLLNNPLCQCTSTTEGDAFLMCLALGMRHSLSWLAMVDILKMVNSLFGSKVIDASKYFLLKYMEMGKEDTTFHIFCEKCEFYLGNRNELKSEKVACGNCSKEFNCSQPSSFFVSIDVEAQIKAILDNTALANEIKTYRFNRRKLDENALEDIYDGKCYKDLLEQGLLSDPLNMSYIFNTDGVNLAQSSFKSVWPIFMSINELSPKNRSKHIILAGLWVGAKDPNMRIFLKPFVETANKLSSDGITWADNNGQLQNSKIYPLCMVVDSGARYKLLNCSSFHSYYGCTFCYHKSENTPSGRRFIVRVPTARLRTHDSMIQDMHEAFKNRNNKNKKLRVVKGVKGPTPLISMKHFDLGHGVVNDFMHSVLLGNCRSHTALILNSFGAAYYAGAPGRIFLMNERLKLIRPPSSITRYPRSIKEVKLWKASEWRSWLLFYSYVCLVGILKTEYLEHLSMLSSAIFILLQKSVVLSDLITARQYLMQYIYLTEKLYGKEAMLYNVHLLLHVVDGVINYGPLWTHNTFSFEGKNHYIMQMQTSPGRVAQQLARRYLTYNAFPLLFEKYAATDTPAEFVEEITGKRLKSFIRCGQCVLIGKAHRFFPDDAVETLLAASNVEVGGNIFSHKKMLYSGVRYCTKNYSEGKKFNDAYIRTTDGKVGFILEILHVNTEVEKKVFLLIQALDVDRTPVLSTPLVTLKHVKKVVGKGDVLLIEPITIKNQCIFMGVDCGNFIVDMPYGCYGD
jgi:hypothetical protein